MIEKQNMPANAEIKQKVLYTTYGQYENARFIQKIQMNIIINKDIVESKYDKKNQISKQNDGQKI